MEEAKCGDKGKSYKVKITNEKSAHGSSMEVDGDVSILDEECLQRRKLWVKAWWKRALWRELDRWDNGSRNWGDYKDYIQRDIQLQG